MNLETYNELRKNGILAKNEKVNLICVHLNNIVSRNGIISELGDNYITLTDTINEELLKTPQKDNKKYLFYEPIIFIETIIEIIKVKEI